MERHLTQNTNETKKLAKKIASDFSGGEIVCLFGDLGSGKTTFTQGMLESLGAEKPYTSPTFNIMKRYDLKKGGNIKYIYHIDMYRVTKNDIMDLGWHDFAGEKNAVTIVEWPEKIKDILPKEIIKISFNWVDENKRKIEFS